MEQAKYFARACGPAQFEESGNGNMQIAIPFEVVDDEQYAGEVITWFATMHETPDKKGKTGKDRVIESLIYMGFQSDDLTALMEISADEARALMPDTVEIVCEPDTYDGVERLKVRWVNRPGSGRASFKKPLSKDVMRSFAAQMKSSLRNARGAGGARPSSPPSRPAGNTSRPSQPSNSEHPNAPRIGDVDDIPFASADIGHEPSPIARVLR
jgi:hypothetical protein